MDIEQLQPSSEGKMLEFKRDLLSSELLNGQRKSSVFFLVNYLVK